MVPCIVKETIKQEIEQHPQLHPFVQIWSRWRRPRGQTTDFKQSSTIRWMTSQWLYVLAVFIFFSSFCLCWRRSTSRVQPQVTVHIQTASLYPGVDSLCHKRLFESISSSLFSMALIFMKRPLGGRWWRAPHSQDWPAPCCVEAEGLEGGWTRPHAGQHRSLHSVGGNMGFEMLPKGFSCFGQISIMFPTFITTISGLRSRRTDYKFQNTPGMWIFLIIECWDNVNHMDKRLLMNASDVPLLFQKCLPTSLL